MAVEIVFSVQVGPVLVGSDTLGLWSFWINALRDWDQQYWRSGAVLIDPVLGGYVGYSGKVLSAPLRNALKRLGTGDTEKSTSRVIISTSCSPLPFPRWSQRRRAREKGVPNGSFCPPRAPSWHSRTASLYRAYQNCDAPTSRGSSEPHCWTS